MLGRTMSELIQYDLNLGQTAVNYVPLSPLSLGRHNEDVFSDRTLANSSGRVLIATSRPSLVSRARHTDPIPPPTQQRCSVRVCPSERLVARFFRDDLPGPVPTEAATVPVDNRIRFHAHECGSPPRPESGKENPQATVRRFQSRLRNLSLQNSDLMSKGDNLQLRVRATLKVHTKRR